jgi:tetratricopeptide (TPR) repeat protein
LGTGSVALLVTVWFVWRQARGITLDEIQAVIAARDAARAEQLLDGYLESDPDDSRAHLMLAGVLASRNDVTGALQHLGRVPDSSEWGVESRYREGSLHRQLHRAAAAEQAWSRCIRADAAMQTEAREIAHESVVQLVILYSVQGRGAAIEQVLWSWHERLPRPQRIRALVALLNVQFGSATAAQTAVPELEKFVRADREDYESRRALGRLLVAQEGQAANGRKLLEECIAAQPTHTETLRAYLDGLIALGDLPAARETIARLPDSARDSAELWHLKGWIHQLSEEWEPAVEALQNSIHKVPNNHEVLTRLAESLRRMNRDADAEQHDRMARELVAAEQQLRSVNDLFLATEGLIGHIDTLSAFTVGELYERFGRVREARAWYEETLRRDDKYADAHEALDRLRKPTEPATNQPVTLDRAARVD